MPKRVFWPMALVVMGLIILAANLGLLPSSLWNLWPLSLIIVGLGGLVVSDREDWMGSSSASSSSSGAKKATAKKMPARKTSSKKKK